MSRPDEDLFLRITELVSLLSNMDIRSTVRTISERTGCSPEQTREDIRLLNKLGFSVSPEEAVEHFNAYDSRYDNEELDLFVDIPGMDYEAPYLLFLESAEKALLERGKLKDLEIKDTPYSFSGDIEEKIAAINEAVKNRRRISFRYFSPRSRQTTLHSNLAPNCLFHNTNDDLWYCISFSGKNNMHAFRLDRIRSVIRLEKETFPEPTAALQKQMERLNLIWGASFELSDEPVHVKIRITPNTPNLLNKIRSDIRGRDPQHARLYKDGGYYIYEDDIIGLSAFNAWLRSFGSSVKVLEPRSLVEKIKTANAIRLENYRNDRFSDEDEDPE